MHDGSHDTIPDDTHFVTALSRLVGCTKDVKFLLLPPALRDVRSTGGYSMRPGTFDSLTSQWQHSLSAYT